MNNEPDVRAALVNARREIAIGKLRAFDWQCHVIGNLVKTKLIEPAVAVDALYDAAIANNLVDCHGVDIIEAILADGMKRGVDDDSQ